MIVDDVSSASGRLLIPPASVEGLTLYLIVKEQGDVSQYSIAVVQSWNDKSLDEKLHSKH